jgi:hypothetical protein
LNSSAIFVSGVIFQKQGVFSLKMVSISCRKKERIILQTYTVSLTGIGVKFRSRRTNHISSDLQGSILPIFSQTAFMGTDFFLEEGKIFQGGQKHTICLKNA